MQLGKKDFDKLEFLIKFQIIHIQTFKKLTIESIFRNIGLILYNFEVVLKTFMSSKIYIANDSISI